MIGGWSDGDGSLGESVQEQKQRIGHLLRRPVGRPPKDVRRAYASFRYQARSWTTPRRVVAKVGWHPGEPGRLHRHQSLPSGRAGGRGGTAGEGKNAIAWTRLSCHGFTANAVRLQLHTLAYNLANFMRTLALPQSVVEHWSLTTLREKLVKIGAFVRHGRYIMLQLAEVAVPRTLFAEILRLIGRLRPRPAPT